MRSEANDFLPGWPQVVMCPPDPVAWRQSKSGGDCVPADGQMSAAGVDVTCLPASPERSGASTPVAAVPVVPRAVGCAARAGPADVETSCGGEAGKACWLGLDGNEAWDHLGNGQWG